jgi:hypothetical protein
MLPNMVFQLSKLESLALYFDTDSGSMAGLPPNEALEKFTAMVNDVLPCFLCTLLIVRFADFVWSWKFKASVHP